jgi:hypothetical protein
MRKILIFCALSALALGAQNACEEYVKQSKIYLNELYEIKAKQLENDPQAFRLFELKFSASGARGLNQAKQRRKILRARIGSDKKRARRDKSAKVGRVYAF